MATKKKPATDKPKDKKAKSGKKPAEETAAAPAEATAPAGDQPNLRIETYMAELPCKLSEEDVKKAGKLAAKLVSRRNKVRAQAKLEAKARRTEIAAIDEQIETHSQEVREEVTHQMVKCERRFNYDTKRVTDVRLDTGEEVGLPRDMTEAELQTFFNFEEPLPPPPGGGSAEDDLDDEFGGGGGGGEGSDDAGNGEG